MKDLYPGVDVRYYFERGFLRFDIFLAPGVNPEIVKWRIEGTDEVLLENNELRFLTRFGWVKLMDLHAFQGNRELECAFSKRENYWTFFVRDYDVCEHLVIDPTVYSTFLGGSNVDESYSIISIPGGNALITGYTLSTNFPTVIGSYDTSYHASMDIFISKFNQNLTDLVFSTFIGGSDDDVGSFIKIGSACNNCIYLTGWTKSVDFPIQGLSYDATYNGGGRCICFEAQ